MVVSRLPDKKEVSGQLIRSVFQGSATDPKFIFFCNSYCCFNTSVSVLISKCLDFNFKII